MRNLKQELFKLVRMLYKKNIFLLLSLVLIFVISVHIRLNAIEPVKIGKHYQEDIEINFSVIDRMFEPEEEKIYINKDVRTKIKKKVEAQKNNKKGKIKNTNKNIKENKTYTYINKTNLNNLNKIEIFFKSNSSNIKDTEEEKIKRFIDGQENKTKLVLKITSYAKNQKTGGDDNSRRLSLDRAINIRSKLINLGVAPENLIVKAFGNVDKNNIKNKVDIEIVKKI